MALQNPDIMRIAKSLVTLWLLCCSQLVFAQTDWSAFLNDPSGKHYEKLRQSIASDGKKCETTVLPEQSQINRLLRLVESGSRFAARAAVLIVECVGVGPGEDINRSLGVFLDKHPAQFLEIAREEAISDENLRYMVTMQPLSLVDDLDGRIRAMEQRIKAVQAVTNAGLKSYRDKVLTLLEKAKGELVRVKDAGAK